MSEKIFIFFLIQTISQPKTGGLRTLQGFKPHVVPGGQVTYMG